MKLEYRYRAGGAVHQGPSGETYEFVEDEWGRRVTEVNAPEDVERFTGLLDRAGNPLFVPVDDPQPVAEVTIEAVAPVAVSRGRGRQKAVEVVADPVPESVPEPESVPDPEPKQEPEPEPEPEPTPGDEVVPDDAVAVSEPMAGEA